MKKKTEESKAEPKPEVIVLKTPQVLKALSDMHSPKEWAFFEELRIGGGYGKDSEPRIDAWAIHYYPSKRNTVRSYEIKVSRSDFFHEIRTPRKRRHALRLSNEYYFVVPKGLVGIEEVPPECGLMEVYEMSENSYQVQTKIKAPYRDTIPPTWLFLASVCRRLDRLRLRNWTKEMMEQIDNETYGIAVLMALQEHIDRWTNFSDGNKEVPDQIAEALRAAKYYALEIVEANRKRRS